MVVTVDDGRLALDLPVRDAGRGRVERLRDELVHLADPQVNCAREIEVSVDWE